MNVSSVILKVLSVAVFATSLVRGYDLTAAPLTITIQELQSPPGPRHSEGIVRVGRTPAANIEEGEQVGLIWFYNDLAVPNTNTPMGTQTGTYNSVRKCCILANTTPRSLNSIVACLSNTGHCVEVSANSLLACYFRFDLAATEGTGTITAEALFDLAVFPVAQLTITGGTGDFLGIIGSGLTFPPPTFDGTTFFYTFEYYLP
jgi:hypothetical protein